MFDFARPKRGEDDGHRTKQGNLKAGKINSRTTLELFDHSNFEKEIHLCRILNRKKIRVEVFGTETNEVADARRGFQNTEFPAISQPNSGEPLIDTSDDGFRGIVGVLRGAAGRRIVVRGEQTLQFPVFSGPLLVFGIKDLRQPAPANIADKDFLFLRRGQFSVVGLELFEQAYGGDIVRIKAEVSKVPDLSLFIS